MPNMIDLRLYTLGARRIFAGTKEICRSDFILQEFAIRLIERTCLLGLTLHHHSQPIAMIDLAREFFPESDIIDAKESFWLMTGLVEEKIRRVHPHFQSLLEVSRGRCTIHPEIEVSSDALQFEWDFLEGLTSNNAYSFAYWSNLKQFSGLYMLGNPLVDSPDILARRKVIRKAQLQVNEIVEVMLNSQSTRIYDPDTLRLIFAA